MSKRSTDSGTLHLNLGKSTKYPSEYNNTLLKGVARDLNRATLGLTKNCIPFSGFDLWTLYELSWLNMNGLPQVAIGEVRVSSNSDFIIESKSFKLYLNSFNQTHFKNWQEVANTMQKDLSKVANSSVDVTLLPLEEFNNQFIGFFSGTCLEKVFSNVSIDQYQYNPNILTNAEDSKIVEEDLYSNLLKSNCLITNQPDWGSIKISYKGPQICKENLLKYIISLRTHNEFHEQCIERIFLDILQYCKPELLTVYARYTRRGGLDINPYRTNQGKVPSENIRFARQ